MGTLALAASRDIMQRSGQGRREPEGVRRPQDPRPTAMRGPCDVCVGVAGRPEDARFTETRIRAARRLRRVARELRGLHWQSTQLPTPGEGRRQRLSACDAASARVLDCRSAAAGVTIRGSCALQLSAAAPGTAWTAAVEDRTCLAARALSQMLCDEPNAARCRATVRRGPRSLPGAAAHAVLTWRMQPSAIACAACFVCLRVVDQIIAPVAVRRHCTTARRPCCGDMHVHWAAPRRGRRPRAWTARARTVDMGLRVG